MMWLVALYVVGWFVTMPLALRHRMNAKVCPSGEICSGDGHSHRAFGHGDCVPRGELRERKPEDYLASAGYAVVWPAFVAGGIAVGIGYTIYGFIWLVGHLAPKTDAERSRERKVIEDKIAKHEREIGRLQAKLDRDNYPDLAITEAMNRG